MSRPGADQLASGSASSPRSGPGLDAWASPQSLRRRRVLSALAVLLVVAAGAWWVSRPDTRLGAAEATVCRPEPGVVLYLGDWGRFRVEDPPADLPEVLPAERWDGAWHNDRYWIVHEPDGSDLRIDGFTDITDTWLTCPWPARSDERRVSFSDPAG